MADENIRVRMELVDKTSATLKNISKELSRTTESFRKLERTSKVVITTQNKTAKAVKETSFSVRDLVAQIGALAIAYKGLQAAKTIAQTSDEFVSAKARLSIVSDDPDALFQDVYQMSQQVRTNFLDMAGTVAKMGINVGVGEGQWFKNTDQLVRFNELLAKTFKTGGQNNKEIAAGMLQLTQAMSSGRLQGDEFRSMFENAPLYISYIGEYMAKVDKHTDAFGNTIAYTAGELKQMAAEGKITTDIMINAMMTGADKIESQFKHLPIRIEEAWTMMTNMLKIQAGKFMDELNKVLNTGAFLSFLNQLSDQLTALLGLLTLVLKAVSPIINFMMVTWKLWSPLALALGTGLALVAAKLTLVELGVTKAGIATHFAAAETESLALAHKVGGEAASFYRIQMRALDDMLGRTNGVLSMAILKNRSKIQGDKLATMVLQSETVALIANTTATKINSFVKNHAILGEKLSILLGKLNIVTTNGETLATTLLTTAIMGLNVAVAYLTIPFMIIMGVAWVVIKVFNKLNGTSYSLSGMLMGVMNVAVTALTNALIDLYNAGVAVWNLFSSHDKEYKARFSYTQAWNEGMEYGNISALDYTASSNELAGLKGDTGQIVDNTASTKEDMEYLRKVAEQRVGDRISNINFTITNNNDMKVNDDRDLDGIVEHITKGLEEALSMGASGAHI